MKSFFNKNIINNILLVLVYSILPLFGLITIYPILVIGLNFSFIHAVISVIICSIIFIILPPIFSIPKLYFIMLLTAALLLLKLLSKKIKPLHIIYLTTIFLIFITTIVYGDKLFNINNSLSDYFNNYLEKHKSVIENNIVYNSDSDFTFDDIKSQIKIIINMLPGIIFAYIFITILVNFYIIQSLSKHKRINFKGPYLPKIELLKMNEWFVWAIILGLATTLFIKNEILYKFGLNFLIFFSILFIVQGCSIVVYFFNKWNVNKIFQILFFIFILLAGLPFIFLGFGLLDVWFDFRNKPTADMRS